MPTALDINCHAVLTAASTSELGIVVRTNDVNKARGMIYRFRRELNDPTFANIQIRVSPNDADHELWLLRLPGITPHANIDNMAELL